MAVKDYEEFTKYYWLTDKQRQETLDNWEFIDNIDFNPYIDDYDDLDELMRAVEEDYYKNAKYNCVFNCMDSYEFGEFLKNKYGVVIQEIITTRYHISKI